MMRSSTKLHLGGYLAAVLVVLSVAAAVPLAQASVPWFNESVKGQKDTEIILDDLVAADYEATYVYKDADGEKQTVILPTLAKDVAGATAGTFNSTLRVLGIDLSAVTAPVADADYDEGTPYVLIELPETAKALFESSAVRYCAGFVLERGAGTAVANSDLAQTYTITVGSGDAKLFTKTVSSEDEDVGDANTNEVGTCAGNTDVDDEEPEFGEKLSIGQVQSFINDAYLVKNGADKPSPLYIRIDGPRALTGVVDEEEGDIFDIAIQFYAYGEGKATAASFANVQLGFGLVALAMSALMMGMLNVPFEHVAPHIRKQKGA